MVQIRFSLVYAFASRCPYCGYVAEIGSGNHQKFATERPTPIMSRNPLVSLTLFFLLVSLAVWLLRHWLSGHSIETNVVMVGNAIVFLATVAALFLYQKAMKKQKPHAFVSQVYSGFLLKFLILVSAALAYFYTAKEINKGAVIICLALYVVYHFMATRLIVKHPRSQ
jgi:hypothetical protein